LVKAVTTDDGCVLAEMHDKSKPHLVCPWHGWEYDLRSGEFSGNRSVRLRSFEIRVDKGQVYVSV
jgi:nitrite reductase (NADH) small subunit